MTEIDMEAVLKAFEKSSQEDEAKAVECSRCLFHRCDPPHGDGRLCLVCAAKPTGEDMQIVINI